jgi:hypothetical protein
MAATVIGWSGLNAFGQALPKSEPTWDYFITGRTGGGYKDNVTLAHLSPEASAFVDSGLEVIALRPPPLPTQFTLFGSFEDHYFFSSKVEQEQTGFGQAELMRVFGGGNWQAGLSLEYLYEDQFLDVSLTETNREAVRVIGQDFIARPKIRSELGSSIWVQLEGPVQRQLFHSPLDNYWEGGPKFIAGIGYGNRSEFTLSYEANYRAYDNEEELSALGEPIPGTHRRTWYHRVQWAVRHYWDQPRHWRTTSRLIYKFSNDSGSGYFNYTGIGFAQQVRYKAKSWEVSGEASVMHYGYEVQTVSETDLTQGRRDELLLNVRVEKELLKHVRAYAQYEREEVFSNLELDQFTVNTVTGGVLWEF